MLKTNFQNIPEEIISFNANYSDIVLIVLIKVLILKIIWSVLIWLAVNGGYNLRKFEIYLTMHWPQYLSLEWEKAVSRLELICNTSTTIGSQQTITVPFGHMQTTGGPAGWTDSFWHGRSECACQDPGRAESCQHRSEWCDQVWITTGFAIVPVPRPNRRQDALFSRKSESSITQYFPREDSLVPC